MVFEHMQGTNEAHKLTSRFLKSPMSTLKKCGRLSPVAHGDRLPAGGILT